MPVKHRAIDPNTRDYSLTRGEYDADVGLSSKVISRVTTRRGSIIVLPNFGSLLHTIKGPIPGFEALAERYIRDSLNDMVRGREINSLVVSVSGESKNGSAYLLLDIQYRTRRGRPQRVNLTYRLTGS